MMGELTCEVTPGQPSECVKLRVNPKLTEDHRIELQFEDRPAKSVRQDDFATRPVAKPQHRG
jgi:hypothetical protein